MPSESADDDGFVTGYDPLETMMPRFHVHLTGLDMPVLDEEGTEFASLEHAYLDTFKAARDLWRELLEQRCDPRGCAFEITDAQGRSLMTVPFSEVLDVCRPAAPVETVSRRPARRARPGDTRTEVDVPVFDSAAAHLIKMQRLAEDMRKLVLQACESLAQAQALLSEGLRPRPDGRGAPE
jgi:hypothetical protein